MKTTDERVQSILKKATIEKAKQAKRRKNIITIASLSTVAAAASLFILFILPSTSFKQENYSQPISDETMAEVSPQEDSEGKAAEEEKASKPVNLEEVENPTEMKEAENETGSKDTEKPREDLKLNVQEEVYLGQEVYPNGLEKGSREFLFTSHSNRSISVNVTNEKHAAKILENHKKPLNLGLKDPEQSYLISLDEQDKHWAILSSKSKQYYLFQSKTLATDELIAFATSYLENLAK